ncbi:hypothetical protein PNOK_0763900 [Pyrrhoderma noxium]|uniref:Uncharacterized protein n=1 Tax=Pyrrhoderma noxium TaxID=2282107 RepID=A0A286U8Z6_9AGAM|nr:hypothetical protein PNOK_0763900 [Pyrrhoderma noxium]
MSSAFSPSSAFLRAISPANFAFIEVQFSVIEQSEGVLSHCSHWQIFQSTNSVNDVIAMVPQDYRHILQEPLLGVAQTTKKANASRATIAKWEQYQATGTFPEHLKFKTPKIQLFKEFRETSEAKEASNALDHEFNTFLAKSLVTSLKAKRDELMFLSGALEPQNILNKLGPKISACTAELCTKQIPEFTNNEKGELIISGWTTNLAAVDLG